MSNYLDDKELFMTPKVTQYGEHMVMTNVHKQPKQKYVNLDTRFRDDFQMSNLINYNITLPERINEVRTISISNIEIPVTFYNISENFGNNTFTIVVSNANSYSVIIPDGNYDVAGITTAINAQIIKSGVSNVQFSVKGNNSVFNNISDQSIVIDFSINSKGESNNSRLKFTLGGILGFSYAQYILNTNSPTLTSTGVINLNTLKYAYVIIDDFSGKGSPSTFSTYLQNSSLSRNILARIQIDTNGFPYGSTLMANISGGLLTANIRNYIGKIALQRFNVQLVNEIGTIIDLNGQDISLSLVVDYE